MTDANKSAPVDVEALITWCHNQMDATAVKCAEALRVLAAELDKERLAGKNTANMVLDMATENKSLRAELAALRAQEPFVEIRNFIPKWNCTTNERENVVLYASPVVPPAAANAVTKSHDELALLRRSISAQLLFLFDRNCRVVGNTLELPFDSHDHAFKQLMQARQLCEILSAQQETPR